MTKRLVDIDDDLLDRARTLIGAATIKETVNTSLREMIDAELRRCHLRRLVAADGMNLHNDGITSRAWR